MYFFPVHLDHVTAPKYASLQCQY